MARKKDWAPEESGDEGVVVKARGPLKVDLPQWFCSSEDFDTMIRQKHPELVVPERDIVYYGLGAPAQEWDETPPAPGKTCPRCRVRPVERGSILCCPKCQMSGFERQLFEQRRLAGYPPAHVEMPAPKKQPPAKAPAKTAAGEGRKQKMWRNYAWDKPKPQPRPQHRPGPSSSTPGRLPAA